MNTVSRLKLGAAAVATLFALGTTAAFAADDAAATPATPSAKSTKAKTHKKAGAPKKTTKAVKPAADAAAK